MEEFVFEIKEGPYAGNKGILYIRGFDIWMFMFKGNIMPTREDIQGRGNPIRDFLQNDYVSERDLHGAKIYADMQE